MYIKTKKANDNKMTYKNKFEWYILTYSVVTKMKGNSNSC